MPAEKPPHPDSQPDPPAANRPVEAEEEASEASSEKMKLATLDIWTLRSDEQPQR